MDVVLQNYIMPNEGTVHHNYVIDERYVCGAHYNYAVSINHVTRHIILYARLVWIYMSIYSSTLPYAVSVSLAYVCVVQQVIIELQHT